MSGFSFDDVGQLVVVSGGELDPNQASQKVMVFDEEDNPINLGGSPWVQITQAAYNALSPPDPTKLYVIVG